MTEEERRIQACIDYINTSTDIVMWVKIMAMKALERMKEQESVKLITCKDCMHNGSTDCPIKWDGKSDEDFCSFGFPEMLDEEATDTQWTIF